MPVSRPCRLVALAAAATVLTATVPAAARAVGISYLDGGNVLLSSPDGASVVQVTPDGTAEDPYRYQAQAATGPIVTARGGGTSWSLSRYAGPTLAREHINVLPYKISGGLQVFPISLSVSRTGDIASYGHSSCTWACQTLSRGTWLALTRGGTSPTNPVDVGFRNTRFLGDRLIGSTGSTISVQKDGPQGPFTEEWEGWLESEDSSLLQATASMEARQLAVVYSGETEGDEGIIVGGHDGNIPGGALGPFCTLPTQADAFHPTFSPDGTLIAWQDAGGVKVAGVPNLAAGTATCTLTGPARVLSPSGSMPSFGAGDAAAVAAARNPAPPAAPAGPAPTPGGTTPGATAPGATTPGATTPGATTPGGSAPGGTATAPKLALSVARTTTRAKLRKGLAVRVTARAKGRVTVTATVPRSVGRRLGLKGRSARIVVAKGTATAARKGPVTVRVRPVKTAVRAVSRMRKVTLTLRATQAKAVGQVTVRVR